MEKQYKKSLFIFRRDLRVEDNTGLIAALHQSERVIPCFIFDTRQIGNTNPYRSTNAIQFMIESLRDLEQQIKKHHGQLYLFLGIAEKVIDKLIQEEHIDALFCNRDYTPFSIERDATIAKVCHAHSVAFNQHHDLLLTEPEEVMTNSNTPYAVFTAFYKKALKKNIPAPCNAPHGTFYTKSISHAQPSGIYDTILKTSNKQAHVHGGTTHAHKIIKSIAQLKNYNLTHDIPALNTSNLSAYLKFGCISVRSVYHAIKDTLGAHHPLLRQLYWRDFFSHVAYHSPFVFGKPYHEKYARLPWSKNMSHFDAWCQGKTGFPIVDAGMRQLNTTGFMHNRVRMIVASFLTKDLHINWLWGEKYFAQQLIDYDPMLNNGNWQWSASTGCDAQPYFRIFNPWLQQKKFDPDCVYIKRWIPELKNIDNKIIHNWFDSDNQTIKQYPRPIINHKIESTLAKKMYKNI